MALPPTADTDVLLHRSTTLRVLRQTRPDGTTVICKQAFGPQARMRLRNERRVLERLAGVAGVPRLAPGDEADDHILLEDDGGQRLSQREAGTPMALPELLRLAGRLARILAAVHQRGVQHRNLHPLNIVLTGADDTPVLIGFEHATTSAEEQPGFIHHSLVTGTLAYGAPEQTGRSGLGIDHRADLYALGALLYEQATGRPPFVEADPLRLIHQHLAVLPVPPIERRPALPAELSDVILHLLEKSPDRRYQSGQGLARDLAELMRPDPAADPRPPFVPGRHDHPDWLAPPSQLVGREPERAVLASALDAALTPQRRAVLVAGAPGVGKTALINTLRPLVTARRGWFVCGKFDQLRQDQDTDAMHQALRALGRLLLAEPEAALAAQRLRLRRTLGPNVGLVTTLLPEFALLLGVEPDGTPAQDVLLAGSQLVQAVLDLLRAIVSPERPLVMVIDDLQWAAAPAIRTFDAILTDARLTGLLLVGAYRAGEVGATHALQARLDRWQQQPGPPWRLLLDNLPPDNLTELLASMMRLPLPQADALARAVAPRTAGNPFDTVELINALRRDGVLVAGDAGWQWDPREIQAHVGRGEVLELLQARIERLPAATIELLEIMACLGGELSLELLQAASGRAPAEVEAQAATALDDGLLVMIDDGVRAIRFRHDRVQQAAYRRLQGRGACRLHLDLARRLTRHAHFRAVAAEQYLPAAALIDDADERGRAARLFHEAAARLRLVSHGMVERLMSAAITLLSGLAGDTDRSLRIAVATERHLSLYNLGQLDEADAAFGFVQRCSDEALDQVEATCLQIASLTHRARGPEAVQLGVALLARLGTEVPTQDPAAIEQGLSALSDTVGPDDRHRPDVSDARVVAVAQLLDRLVIPTLQCAPDINAWLAVESRRLWTVHGPCPALVRSAALSMPLVLMARRQAYGAAHTLARQTLSVGEARGYELATATARHVHAIATQHWFGPLEDSIAQAREAHEALLRGGDLQFACLTYNATTPAVLDSAPALQTCIDEVDRGLAFAQRTGNEFAQGIYRTYRQLLRSLTEPTEPPGSLDDASFDEAARQSGRLAVGTLGVTFHLLRALSAALFDDLPRLQSHIAAAMPLLGAMPGFYPTAWAHALNALAMAGRIRAAAPGADLAEARAALAGSRAWMTQRAADQPGNFLHLQHWIEAEQAWALGDERAAARAFDAAMDRVATRSRAWHRALITERAARFHLDHGLVATGRCLLAEARQAHEHWGATAKVQRLMLQHPFLRPTAHRPEAREPADGGPTPARDDHAIDLLAVVRASQLLSSETSLERLTARVVELMGAMTGATDVHLALRREAPDGWLVLAADAAATPAMPLDLAGQQGLVPMSAFRYAERTRQPLVIDDAMQDDRFAGDPHLAGLQRCALLVLPILSQGEARAMLLLENRLATGCFAADRLDAVQLVAAQLAVSLENARLYAELEARVEQRTRELQDAQAQLLDTARRAGMAEIATNVLHNVGNVLNSVNVSADLIGNRLRQSKVSGFGRAMALMNEHPDDLGHFLTHDDKGRRLPGYLNRLVQAVAIEQSELAAELELLVGRVGHIKDIVATQQSYAGRSSVVEPVEIGSLVHDALQMNEASMARHHVRVETRLAELSGLRLDRSRVLQILVNLLANAKNACTDHGRSDALVRLQVDRQGERLHITVSDNGIGIAPEHLTRVFAHGFTTRKDGHGFGLHSCVLAARDMGGTLTARSDGPGRGATFELEIPTGGSQAMGP
ncbi:trifunctional serine/threonine-protein kinase/ATP-binding protein/sensor histidine kinase [Sphaerotilus hippei]|nr:AAA family ATPase [Sphaerotilus hippei]